MIKVIYLSQFLPPFPNPWVSKLDRVEEWGILFAYVLQLPYLNGLHDSLVLSPFFRQHVGRSVGVGRWGRVRAEG